MGTAAKSVKRKARLRRPGYPLAGLRRLFDREATTQPSATVSQAVRDNRPGDNVMTSLPESLESLFREAKIVARRAEARKKRSKKQEKK
jgi:hypothetical protein